MHHILVLICCDFNVFLTTSIVLVDSWLIMKLGESLLKYIFPCKCKIFYSHVQSGKLMAWRQLYSIGFSFSCCFVHALPCPVKIVSVISHIGTSNQLSAMRSSSCLNLQFLYITYPTLM